MAKDATKIAGLQLRDTLAAKTRPLPPKFLLADIAPHHACQIGHSHKKNRQLMRCNKPDMLVKKLYRQSLVKQTRYFLQSDQHNSLTQTIACT
jgi:hypothetical protein